MKLTKRKGFNFYRSYYDVFNKLPEKDKLEFIKALLDKQFLDVEPSKLTGMVDFAWISQYNSIDQQVKGYKSKTKDPMQGGSVGGSVRGVITPTLQEEEKGKEKGKEQYVETVFPFSDFWTLYPKKVGLKDCEKKYNKISEVNRGLIKNTLNNFIKHKPFESYTHPNPSTYLNQERWNDVLTPVVKSSNAFVMDKF